MDIFNNIQSEKGAIQSISQLLFNAEIQLHILHLQAIKKSFEIHSALGGLYEALGDLNDDLVEKSYTVVGLMDKYKDMKIGNNIDPLSYVQSLFGNVQEYRKYIKTGYIQQMVDNILESISHCLYKLHNLL